MREVRRAMGMAMGFRPAVWLPPCTGARTDHIELMLRDVGRGSFRATGPFVHRTLLVPDLGAAPLAASRRVWCVVVLLVNEKGLIRKVILP